MAIEICESYSTLYTGLNISKAVLEVISFYEIGKNIIAATTDNGSNMATFAAHLQQALKESFNNAYFQHYHCAALTLNLIVMEGLKLVDTAIVKARSFASTIRNSQPIFRELKQIFDMKNRHFLVPDLDVPTRWNSTFLMIEKLRKIREITDILVTSNISLKSDYPNESEWLEIDVSLPVVLTHFYYNLLTIN